MRHKFKISLLFASVFALCVAHADEIKQDVYLVQVLKNGALFFGQAVLLSTEGHWADAKQSNRKDQVKIDCNGDTTLQMQTVERERSALVAARRDANIIKASIVIKDVEPQNLPANGLDGKCVAATPSEQMMSKFDLEFVVTDPAKAEFTKDFGNGYSVVLKASRFIR